MLKKTKTRLTGWLGAAVLVTMAAPVSAATIVTTLDTPLVADGNSVYLDLNSDGADDLRFRDETIGGSVFGQSVRGSEYYTRSYVLRDRATGIASILGEGVDVNDALADGVNTAFARNGAIYGPFSGGLENVGDSGYIGIRIDRYTLGYPDGCNGCEIGPEGTLVDSLFAWAEVEHGSLIVSSYGIGDAPGVAATTPLSGNTGGNPGGGNTGGGTTPSPVPLPAGAPLLLLGLGALALTRRKTS